MATGLPGPGDMTQIFRLGGLRKGMRSKRAQIMEEVTTTVNETQRRAITLQAIRDVDDLFDNWEKSSVTSINKIWITRV